MELVMRKTVFASCLAVAGSMLGACVNVPLAPGAENVKITRAASDVESCKPVGNIDHVQPYAAEQQMQNQAISLGGNVVFDTTIGESTRGVIYRCTKQ